MKDLALYRIVVSRLVPDDMIIVSERTAAALRGEARGAPEMVGAEQHAAADPSLGQRERPLDSAHGNRDGISTGQPISGRPPSERLRDESTPEGREIWAKVDKAAKKEPAPEPECVECGCPAGSRCHEAGQQDECLDACHKPKERSEPPRRAAAQEGEK